MTHWPANVLVPYARFLECQDRRRRFAAGVTPVDRPPAGEGDAVPAPPEPPTTSSSLDPDLPGRAGGNSRHDQIAVRFGTPALPRLVPITRNQKK